MTTCKNSDKIVSQGDFSVNIKSDVSAPRKPQPKKFEVHISDFDNFGRIFLISERTFYFINSKNNTEKICLEEIEKVINYLEKAIKCIE